MAERVEILFHGHVQGVGFRFTVIEIAERFRDVTGYVRNTPRGDVELVAEGPAESLQLFIGEVQSAMAGYIHSVDRTAGTPTGEFASFIIRR